MNGWIRHFYNSWMLDQAVSQTEAPVGLLDALSCLQPLLQLPSVLWFLLWDGLCRESSFLPSLRNSATLLNSPTMLLPPWTLYRCEICEVITLNRKNYPILMPFKEFWQHASASGSLVGSRQAVLCYVRVMWWPLSERVFFLSPSYADLSGEIFPI